LPDATVEALAKAGPGAELPLRAGVYVNTNTACEDATDGTAYILRAHAIEQAGRACRLVGVSRAAETTYTVVVSCPSPTPEDSRDDVETWELTSPTSFSRRDRSGWRDPVRLCPSGELPVRWRGVEP
jgi:hypothetical protein